MDDEPRYVVHEIWGYSAAETKRHKFSTDVWVGDHWYLGKEVRIWRAGTGSPRLEVRRAAAQQLCAQLNAEHDALLASEGMASR